MKFRILLFGLLCMCWNAVQSIPAYPGLIKTKQPSGQTIEIYLSGDENNHWARTPDGYTLLRDTDGFWTFAHQDKKGHVIASDLRYIGNSEIAIKQKFKKGLIPRPIAYGVKQSQPKLRTGQLQIDNSFPTKGKRKLLLLLLNYADTHTTYTQTDFQNFMNQPNYKGIGSFRDYYLDQSYGQLDIETTVTPWVTLTGSKRNYGSEGAVTMIIEALKSLDNTIDLREFDNDGDGILDGLAVIHQGTGQEMTGNSEDIWSHSYEIRGFSMDGIEVRRYTIQPECMGGGVMTTIGVICHEFGHNLGAPDFYDTDYEQTGGDYGGTGIWDLMGSGAWNGDTGNRPAGINMWQRWMFGWCQPQELTETTQVKDMETSTTSPVAYKINTTVPGEYYILENRQKTGAFDVALPGSGLLIYHVDETLVSAAMLMNTLNVTYPQALYTVCANANNDPSSNPSSYGDLTSAGAPFPGSSGCKEFSDYSLPSAKSRTGRMSYFKLSNIDEQQGKISFDYIREKAPASPAQLMAEAVKGTVKLNWQAPQADTDYGIPVRYTVYCNNIRLAETDKLSYLDENPISDGLLTYSVDATYENGLVSPYVTITTMVPGSIITEASAQKTDEGNVLHWTLDNRLTRTELNLQTGEYNELTIEGVDSIDFVQCFNADDLLVYKGSKITHVAFFPMTAPTYSSYCIRIWETDKNNENPHIVASREVTEFGMSSWRNIQLSEPVTLVKGRTYYIGAHVKCKGQKLTLITDVGPYQKGGCLLKEGDEWSEPENPQGHFFIYATLSTPEFKRPTEVTGLDDEVTDPVTELAFPVGFRIYRDGQEIGTSGNTLFIDTNAPEGEHLYAFSCLYKGSNESEAFEFLFDEKSPSGIEKSKAKSPQLNILPNSHIQLANVFGQVWITDVAGRLILTQKLKGMAEWQLPAGIYLVKTSTDDVFKVCVP